MPVAQTNNKKGKRFAPVVVFGSCPIKVTECFGAQEVDIFFMNNIFNLKENCVLRTLKNRFAIF
jgi:hypothetical protein